MLWFEVERACNDTKLSDAHPEYVLQDKQYCVQGYGLYNLGDPAARAYMVDHVSALITEGGIDHYRHDMNFDPLPFWQQHDQPDRLGITEAHYVAGKYAYLDELRLRH
eukprot:SAG22_NODE_2451_length_2557_cov_1.670871_1_plen_107_part_10